MSEQDRYQALRASRLAAELTDEQCRTLAGKIELCDLANGELLVREGAPDDRLFVIVSGALGVVRHPQGEPPVPLHPLVAGDFAGERAVIGRGPDVVEELGARAPLVRAAEEIERWRRTARPACSSCAARPSRNCSSRSLASSTS